MEYPAGSIRVAVWPLSNLTIICREEFSDRGATLDLETRYTQEPSYDTRDALRLVLLFHSGGVWGEAQKTEWLRITGTTEATTKVMCEHVRSALACLDSDEREAANALRSNGSPVVP